MHFYGLHITLKYIEKKSQALLKTSGKLKGLKLVSLVNSLISYALNGNYTIHRFVLKTNVIFQQVSCLAYEHTSLSFTIL